MDMDITPSYIKSIVGNVAANLNYTEWKYSQEEFENIGQNYFGVLIPVVLNGKVNGVQASARLVLKLAPTEQRDRVSGAVTFMFSREIFCYSTLLKQYRLQQTSFQTHYIIPECYYVRREYCKEVIVMKDMRADGFKPYTRSKFLNFSHMSVCLKSLASFHAHSFILRKMNKALYEEAQSVCLPLTLKSNKRFMEVMEDRLNKAISKFVNTKYAEIFQKLKSNQVSLIEATSGSVRDTCICHGDMWKENILFKYDNDVPVSACLIDYQTARMSSPAFDVLYMIITSADTNLRRLHYTNMLNIYYIEFIRVLREAGQYENVYSQESFEEDLKTVGPACLIVANTAFWLANGLQKEGHIRSKLVLNTEDDAKIALETYKNIMKNVVDDFLTYGYLESVYEQ